MTHTHSFLLSGNSEGWVYGGKTNFTPLFKPVLFTLFLRLLAYLAGYTLRRHGFVTMAPLNNKNLQLKFHVFNPHTHPHTQARSSEPPLVWIHGFGIGIVPYVSQLVKWRIQYPNRALVVPELTFLGTQSSWGISDVTSLPSMSQLCEEILLQIQAVARSSHTYTHTVQFDVAAHSYGTAVASVLLRQVRTIAELKGAIHRTQRAELDDSGVLPHSMLDELCVMKVRRVALFDPVCFLTQLSKASQLVYLNPWQVTYPDHTSCRPPPPLHMTRRALYEFGKWCLCRVLLWLRLCVCSYVVFTDVGSVWANTRQMHGVDYVERGDIVSKGSQAMIVTAEEDLILAGSAVRRYLQKINTMHTQGPDQTRSRGALRSIHISGAHGACLADEDVVRQMTSFLFASEHVRSTVSFDAKNLKIHEFEKYSHDDDESTPTGSDSSGSTLVTIADKEPCAQTSTHTLKSSKSEIVLPGGWRAPYASLPTRDDLNVYHIIYQQVIVHNTSHADTHTNTPCGNGCVYESLREYSTQT